MGPTASTFFSQLQGSWQCTRHANNPALPEYSGLIEGSAEFISKKTLEYSYREHWDKKNNEPFHAYRQYIYKLNENAVEIYFDERPLRLFLSLDFSDVADSSFAIKQTHRCKEDLYTVQFACANLTEMSIFTVAHDVEGPRNNYSLVTIYKRIT